MFVIVELQILFHTWCVGMLMIYLCSAY